MRLTLTFWAAVMCWWIASERTCRCQHARFVWVLMSYWEYLEPCVRAHFAKRVSVLGAESTGTTTLARHLAEYYRTIWVPEYGRDYCEKLQAAGADLWTYQWPSEEFTQIAHKQQEMEDVLAREANRILNMRHRRSGYGDMA